MAPLKALVVDERPHPTANLLRWLGYEVRICSSGSAAFLVAREFNPDVALVSLGLPGLGAAPRLRNACGFGKPFLVAVLDDGGDPDRGKRWAPGFDALFSRSGGPVVLQRVLERGVTL
jgi:CheY-like chemotaxis protein